MYHTNRKTLLAIVVVLLALACLSVACGATEEPPPTKMPVEEPTEEPTKAGPTPTPWPTLPTPLSPKCPDDLEPRSLPLQFWVPDHVIVIGQAAEIQAVLDEVRHDLRLAKMGIVVDFVQAVDTEQLAYAGGIAGLQDPRLPPKERPFEDFVMEVYLICSSKGEVPIFWDPDQTPGPVPDALSTDMAVHLMINEHGNDRAVYADLGFAAGLLGAPYSPMPSPWLSSTFDYEGTEADDDFHAQWAFGDGPGGIDLTSAPEATDDSGIVPPVLVGVFDTSPYNDAGPHDIDWTGPVWQLEVVIPPSYPVIPGDQDVPQIESHGLTVSALAHKVAGENSRVILYRVLDSGGSGTLLTLDLALHNFIQYAVAERDAGNISGAVINLSLGVYTPDDSYQRGLLPTNWLMPTSAAFATGPSATPAPIQLPQSLHPALWPYGPDTAFQHDLHSLRFLLAAAVSNGIPVIAASGNQSSGPSIVRDSQLPASYPLVLAVSSTNFDGQLACFSNGGQISAPGGDGIREGAAPAQEGGSPCGKDLDQCKPECVLLGPTFDHSTGAQAVAYWAGTSFSTPLVSGLAARELLQAHKAGEPISAVTVYGSLRDAAVEVKNQHGVADENAGAGLAKCR